MPTHPSGRIGVGLLAAALLLAPVAARGQAPLSLREHQLKALFLFNFAKFVEWPAAAFPQASTPVTIAVVGSDEVGVALRDIVRDATIGGRRLAVKQVASGDTLPECHVLFVGHADRARLAALLAEARTASILTVGEVEEFIPRGGMINFFRVGDNIRFEINPEAAARAGLKVSAKLFSVGRVVTPGRAREAR